MSLGWSFLFFQPGHLNTGFPSLGLGDLGDPVTKPSTPLNPDAPKPPTQHPGSSAMRIHIVGLTQPSFDTVHAGQPKPSTPAAKPGTLKPHPSRTGKAFGSGCSVLGLGAARDGFRVLGTVGQYPSHFACCVAGICGTCQNPSKFDVDAATLAFAGNGW